MLRVFAPPNSLSLHAPVGVKKVGVVRFYARSVAKGWPRLDVPPPGNGERKNPDRAQLRDLRQTDGRRIL
jgi:hypothetical protein